MKYASISPSSLFGSSSKASIHTSNSATALFDKKHNHKRHVHHPHKHCQCSFCTETPAAQSPLDTEDIMDRIKKVLGEMERAKMDESKPLTMESKIYDDIGLDSLDFVEFGIALEDEFGIEIEDDKAEGIVTVGDAIQLIKDTPEAQ